MGLKKIGDVEYPCLSSEHNPPGHIVLPPGIYRWTCPMCGKSIEFSVPAITCSVQQPNKIPEDLRGLYFSDSPFNTTTKPIF